MQLLSLTLLVLLLIISKVSASLHTIYRSSCRHDAVFKLTDRNKVILATSNNVLSTLRVESLSMCAKNCPEISNCLSFDYMGTWSTRTEKNCKMLNVNKTSPATTLTDAVGWNHYEPINQVS